MNLCDRAIAIFCLVLCTCATGQAGESTTPASASERPKLLSRSSIHLEVMMVSLPQADAIGLLPDLRVPEKADAAVAKVLDAIQSKNAILLGYPILQVMDGQRCEIDAHLEKSYPVDLKVPPLSVAGNRKTLQGMSEAAIPTEFDHQFTGIWLEAKAQVIPEGNRILVTLHALRKGLHDEQMFQTAPDKNKRVFHFYEPQFFHHTVETSIVLKSGQSQLIGIHKSRKPEDHLELFILRAESKAIP